MHRDAYVTSADIKTDDGTEWRLTYYVRNAAKRNKRPVYGVTIEKRAANGALIETSRSPAFTAFFEEAERMAARLAEGTVTPAVLLEILDECLA